jgi:hypothetical protein
MTDSSIDVLSFASPEEAKVRDNLLGELRESPVPDNQLLENLGLYLDAKNLSRILLMDFLYRKIVPVQGVVMDFGTRWGNNFMLFQTLRSIYEPFNRHRKVLGFDTFVGFPEVSKEDGGSGLMYPGNLKVTDGYADRLRSLYRLHESLNPLSHIEKNAVVEGDAIASLEEYLRQNPHTVVALAYFDFDIYAPTKACLTMLRDRLTKGSVVAFDEVNDADSPGETVALMETFGLNNIRLERFPFASRVSFFVVE